MSCLHKLSHPGVYSTDVGQYRYLYNHESEPVVISSIVIEEGVFPTFKLQSSDLKVTDVGECIFLELVHLSIFVQGKLNKGQMYSPDSTLYKPPSWQPTHSNLPY